MTGTVKKKEGTVDLMVRKEPDKKTSELLKQLSGETGDPSQAWETGKNPEEEITLGTLVNRPPFSQFENRHGHSHLASTRIPEWMERSFTRIKEKSGKVYDTRSDMYRDGLYLGLLVLTLRTGAGPSILAPTFETEDELHEEQTTLDELAIISSRLDMMPLKNARETFRKIWAIIEGTPARRQEVILRRMSQFPNLVRLAEEMGGKFPSAL